MTRNITQNGFTTSDNAVDVIETPSPAPEVTAWSPTHKRAKSPASSGSLEWSRFGNYTKDSAETEDGMVSSHRGELAVVVCHDNEVTLLIGLFRKSVVCIRCKNARILGFVKRKSKENPSGSHCT
ncbi:hypothetical protein CIHG_02981 [Coccidioides immitis H538.4]|uniref:Uncharacterized protein n=3 Tax=Coccidioides immitis TaxID=5501 RepID=A0A0J8R5L7_COCIT|nr:hypothetical protein CIRG_07685 [Coccidioides immitis RMSCC 2394]KMU79710.1 hypothetical protein CISG_02128 [Coccidioides immitis RMSCC 3703]KMU85198.1 hypothetical protein CIHG_02981 [Coccidioides immitis H538.4]